MDFFHDGFEHLVDFAVFGVNDFERSAALVLACLQVGVEAELGQLRTLELALEVGAGAIIND